MLALHASFSGIDPQAWHHLYRLLLPPPRGGHLQRRQPLILFIENGQVVQVLRRGERPGPAEHAALLDDLRTRWRGPGSLRSLRRSTGAPFVAAIEDDGLVELARAIEARVRTGDDLLTQGLSALQAIQGQLGRKVHVDPNPLVLPVPRPDQAQRAFDLLLPDERSLILYIVDRGRVWTSLVVQKRRGAITHVTTHLGLMATSYYGPTGDLRRDARLLQQAVAARLAPPHLGLFITLDAWRQVVGPQPGALARAVALGDAVVEPMPTWLLAAAGLGAATGLAEGAGRLLGRFLPKGVMDMAKQVGLSPFQVIGVDPLELWNRLTGLLRGE
jgi:hypothetical protein